VSCQAARPAAFAPLPGKSLPHGARFHRSRPAPLPPRPPLTAPCSAHAATSCGQQNRSRLPFLRAGCSLQLDRSPPGAVLSIVRANRAFTRGPKLWLKCPSPRAARCGRSGGARHGAGEFIGGRGVGRLLQRSLGWGAGAASGSPRRMRSGGRRGFAGGLASSRYDPKAPALAGDHCSAAGPDRRELRSCWRAPVADAAWPRLWG